MPGRAPDALRPRVGRAAHAPHDGALKGAGADPGAADLARATVVLTCGMWFVVPCCRRCCCRRRRTTWAGCCCPRGRRRRPQRARARRGRPPAPPRWWRQRDSSCPRIDEPPRAWSHVLVLPWFSRVVGRRDVLAHAPCFAVWPLRLISPFSFAQLRRASLQECDGLHHICKRRQAQQQAAAPLTPSNNPPRVRAPPRAVRTRMTRAGKEHDPNAHSCKADAPKRPGNQGGPQKGARRARTTQVA